MNVFSYFNKTLSLIKNAKASEAPENAPFGKYLWPKHREGFKKIELDEETEIEKEVYSQLKTHFSDDRKGVSALASELLSACMALGWYKRILHPPPYKILYRGLHFKNIKNIEKLVGEDDLDDSGIIKLKDPITIQPDNGFSTSWTYKKAVSRDFSEAKKTGFAVTLYANAADNKNRFLAGPGGLYDVEGLSKYHLEKETVGLEPIKIAKIEWKKIGS